MIRPLRKVLDTVIALLRQGTTPEKIAQATALAAVLAVFPVLGSTTLLCAGGAAWLRLNLPLMQLVNYLLYPAQLALLIPFMSVGSHFFSLPSLPPLSQLLKLVATDPWGAIRIFWPATLSGIGAWLVLSPVAALAIYNLVLFPLRRLNPTEPVPAGEVAQ